MGLRGDLRMAYFIVCVLAFPGFQFSPIPEWCLRNHLIWKQILMTCDLMEDNFLINTVGKSTLVIHSLIHLWLILKVIYWKVLPETRNQSARAIPQPNLGLYAHSNIKSVSFNISQKSRVSYKSMVKHLLTAILFSHNQCVTPQEHSNSPASKLKEFFQCATLAVFCRKKLVFY